LMKPFRPFLPGITRAIDRFWSELFPGMFAAQFLYLAKSADSPSATGHET
jgi:hypothetical protein